jgi:hypothetical protein
MVVVAQLGIDTTHPRSTLLDLRHGGYGDLGF